MLKKFTAVMLTLLVAALPLGGLAHAETLGANLITNPSVETPSATDATMPDGWQFEQYDDTAVAGTSTATNTYLTTGHTGTRALETTISNYVDGDVDWAQAAPVTVTPNTSYRFSDWYKSGTTTEIDLQINYAAAADVPTTDGCSATDLACYDKLVDVNPSADWAQAIADFTAPAKAVSVSVYHLIATNGTLTTDDYSLTTYAPTPFSKPLVSVTFDDGWANQYTNAASYMQSKGMPGTCYIISGSSVTEYYDGSPYMNSSQVVDLHNMGDEVASHTVHHCNLSTAAGSGEAPSDDLVNCPTPLPSDKVVTEMQQSKSTLEGLIGAPVTDFAYPYGSYDTNSIAVGQSLGYLSQRTVNPGYNTKDNFDATQLKMYEVDSNVTVAQVETWISDAIAQGVWLVLCYHEVADAPSDPSDTTYTTHIKDFQDEMDYLATQKSQNLVNVETVAQALQEVQNQIGGVIPPIVLPGKPGDANGDGVINLTDLSILSSHWGVQTGATLAQGDLNADGAVNLTDLSILSTNWGK